MINFIRLQIVKQLHQIHGVAEVSEVEKHAYAIDVWIGIEVVYARGIECARAANDAVHLIALLKQEIGEITAILSGNAGNERLLHEPRLALKQTACTSKRFSSSRGADCFSFPAASPSISQ